MGFNLRPDRLDWCVADSHGSWRPHGLHLQRPGRRPL